VSTEHAPPFEPVGPIARWRVIYDLLRPLKVGEILTYEAMATALKLDPETDRHVIQMSARRALKELLNIDHRASKAIVNVGYRVAKPAEHVTLAVDRNKRAGRQLVTGRNVSTKVDLNGVDSETRAALELLAAGFSRQMEINRRVAAKQQQTDEAIELLTRRVEDIERRT
jgi:hypothetical protein